MNTISLLCRIKQGRSLPTTALEVTTTSPFQQVKEWLSNSDQVQNIEPALTSRWGNSLAFYLLVKGEHGNVAMGSKLTVIKQAQLTFLAQSCHIHLETTIRIQRNTVTYPGHRHGIRKTRQLTVTSHISHNGFHSLDSPESPISYGFTNNTLGSLA